MMMVIHRRCYLLLTTIQFLVAIDFLLLLLPGSASRVDGDDELHLETLKIKARSQYHRHRQTAWRQCSDQPIPSIPSAKGRSSPASSTSPTESKSQRGRRAAGRKSSDTVIYLSSSRGQWAGPDKSVPDHIFSASLWCKPDGGQQSPAVILEARDLCVPFPERGWSFGFHDPDTSGEKDLRLYFKLHSWSSHRSTTLTSPVPLAIGQWTQLAATFDGEVVRFYQNGVQVAVTNDQGASPPTSPGCRTLFIGGNTGQHFRGKIDDLRIWNSTLSPENVRRLASSTTSVSDLSPKLQDDFTKMDSWQWFGELRGSDAYNSAILVPSDAPSTGLNPVQARRNLCGYSICDSPDVISFYSDHRVMRKFKILRYRVVVISDDDGTNPTVTKEQIRKQHEYLVEAMKPYNITWELEETNVRNSSLRRRVILLGCPSSMVGNGQCDQECRHSSTGNDGGDCGRSSSSPSFKQSNNHLRFDVFEDEEHPDDGSKCYDDSLMGNGVCDDVCNDALHSWDGGDCCLEEGSSRCFDPNSPHRSYMDVKELKQLLRLKNTRHINVLFAQWTNKDVLGVATFPWEKNIFNEIGGVVLRPSSYGVPGQMSTLVHEIGHVLGLWHVHRGVSEIDCGHSCYEKEASMIHGDLCGDTNPTPENWRCHDPLPDTASVCGTSNFENTPYSNYMSYADDFCVEHFTSHQVARMHCHADLLYGSITVKNRYHLLPPPLLLSVISSSPTDTTLSWIPSLAMSSLYDTHVCGYCSELLEYSQYAAAAESSDATTSSSGVWLPEEATGPPDAEPCQLSYKMWLPDDSRCPNHVCTLTVRFETAVVPSLLQLWVTWNAQRGIKNVELVFEDGSSDVITGLPAQCDAPLTIPVSYSKALKKVHIRTSSRFVGVDAVNVVSTPSNPVCSPCKPLKYKISRKPPFKDKKVAESDYPIFVDSEVEQGKRYSYSVQAYLGSKLTDPSPMLHFMAGSPICGDGKINQNELCDDGGLADGDGCSSRCQTEEGFHCSGEPSVCYWHEGDGLCEEFELESSPVDCGFYTPPGFIDQWTYRAEAGPKESCRPEIVTGPPVLPFTCFGGQTSETSWTPCGLTETNWLTVNFFKPVVATSVLIYLTSDGTNNPYERNSKQKIFLLDSGGRVHHEQEIRFSCKGSRPHEIPIIKDLSKSFTETASINISFSNAEVSIAAVRLRSSSYLQPLEIMECGTGQQYHPGLKQCDNFCRMPSCPKPNAKHATVNCTGREDGDVCEVTCDPGYKSYEVGPFRLVCYAGSWKGSEPSCKPLDCGMPLIAHADAVCPEGTTFGKTCSYKCRPPARSVGGGNGFGSVLCEANGRWTRPSNVMCQVNCPSPSSTISSVLASTKCRKMDSFLYGQTCRFRCKGGYHVQGQSARKRILYLRCDRNATWVGPLCVPMTCPSIEIPHNCTSGNQASSECTVVCPTQTSKTTHRCEIDGTWNPPLPQCLSFPICQEPQAKDKNVQFVCEGSHVGAICKTSCFRRDYEPVRPNVVNERIKVKCLANGTWYPDANDVICTKKCSSKQVADGYCDASNNRQQCDWDGGDCCSSTAPRNTVVPFPDDCGEACACKDPSAAENIHLSNETLS